jgi:hypothetical protein
MLRSAYILLLRIHPAQFRQRFGDEMLESFDHAQGLNAWLWLLVDALVSLLRQWTVRPEFRRPSPASNDGQALLFQTMELYQPLPSALLNGTVVTLVLFCGLTIAVTHADKTPRFLIGAFHPGPLQPVVARASVAEAAPDATIKVGSAPADPWRKIAAAYFENVRVLQALDTDHDFSLSPRELAMAPAALRTVDSNHDGRLTAEECGFSARRNWQARRSFMRKNPALEALDRDGSSEISASEIANATSALERLDQNGDGSLTPDELIPYEKPARR